MDRRASGNRADVNQLVSSKNSAAELVDRPLTIVIPVYNEGANFPALWEEMKEHLDFPFSALVAYDFEGDDTLPVVRRIIGEGETRLQLIKNTYGRGVVGAIRTGFDAALAGPVLVVMADLSDDLAQVRKMLELYQERQPHCCWQPLYEGRQTHRRAVVQTVTFTALRSYLVLVPRDTDP